MTGGMPEEHRRPDRPMDWRDVAWWIGSAATLVVADIALVIGTLFWAPALRGVKDTGLLFDCRDLACVYRGYAVGLSCLVGTIVVFGLVLPRLAPARRALRWGALTAYAGVGLCALFTALTYGPIDVTYVFTGHAAVCLIVLAVGCHARLRRQSQPLRPGAKP
jgi:hypothetical protein